jgi:glyoxylase-like metal-dependent hydrolase (beta-lactamase superfamily II)
MPCRTLLAASLAFIMVGGAAFAQMAPPNPNAPLTFKPLKGGVYWVEGGISNTGFVVGDTGVVVIDAQMFIPGAKTVLAEIAKITPRPVNTLILTHSDPDHINGLPAYPLGMTIIAQENTKTDMQAALADPHPNFTAPSPAMKDYLPTKLVHDRERLVLDGVPMQLLHVAPAHTDGDLVIYLPRQRIVFAGDLLTPAVGAYPGIHLNKHGSSLGWIQSVKAIAALDADVFISGHGDPQTKAEVLARIKVAEDRRALIKTLVDQHKSLAELKAALNEPPPTGAPARFPTFTETTYQELTAGQASPH